MKDYQEFMSKFVDDLPWFLITDSIYQYYKYTVHMFSVYKFIRKWYLKSNFKKVSKQKIINFRAITVPYD